jgi:hypothetical protein
MYTDYSGVETKDSCLVDAGVSASNTVDAAYICENLAYGAHLPTTLATDDSQGIFPTINSVITADRIWMGATQKDGSEPFGSWLWVDGTSAAANLECGTTACGLWDEFNPNDVAGDSTEQDCAEYMPARGCMLDRVCVNHPQGGAAVVCEVDLPTVRRLRGSSM